LELSLTSQGDPEMSRSQRHLRVFAASGQNSASTASSMSLKSAGRYQVEYYSSDYVELPEECGNADWLPGVNPALLVPLNLEHDGPNAHPSESLLLFCLRRFK